MKNIEIPKRIAALPKADNGYPVPYFIPVIDGKPDFRMADEKKRQLCKKNMVCWICGQSLADRIVAFAGGPLSMLNRRFSDGPMHLECAEFSMKVCPHILNPGMQRKDLSDRPQAITTSVMADNDRVEYFALYHTRRGMWRFDSDPATGYWCWCPEPAREIVWWDKGVAVPDPWAQEGGWRKHAQGIIDVKMGEKMKEMQEARRRQILRGIV